MFETNFSHISRVHISKSKRCFSLISSTYYFHLKTKIVADFEICISVPLMTKFCRILVKLTWFSFNFCDSLAVSLSLFFLIEKFTFVQHSFSSFHTSASFLYALKTLESFCFSGVFKGYRKGTLQWNRFNKRSLSVLVINNVLIK